MCWPTGFLNGTTVFHGNEKHCATLLRNRYGEQNWTWITFFRVSLQRFQYVKWKMNDQINSHLKYSHLIISIKIWDHIHNFWFRIQYVNVIKIWLTIEFLAFGRPMLLKQGAGIEQFEGLQISSFDPYGKGDFFKRNPSKNL